MSLQTISMIIDAHIIVKNLLIAFRDCCVSEEQKQWYTRKIDETSDEISAWCEQLAAVQNQQQPDN